MSLLIALTAFSAIPIYQIAMNVYRFHAMVLALAFGSLSGCASIISGRHADVTFSSNVPNTHVVVRDKRGSEVASIDAPAVIALKRKDRFVFPAKYTATFEAQGYVPVVVPINPTVNPWVAGNLLAGGVIGIVVDNATGAAWKPKQDKIVAHMMPAGPMGPLPCSPIASAPLLTPTAAPYPITQTSQQALPPVEHTARNVGAAATSATSLQ